MNSDICMVSEFFYVLPVLHPYGLLRIVKILFLFLRKILMLNIKNVLLIWTFAMSIILLPETIHSQTVKGQVTSAEDHEPLIGASIMISNTGKGTVTDVDGRFVLTDLHSGDSIYVKYIGMKDAVVVYTGQSTIQVSLTPNTKVLDEMVVVGYGSQRRSAITGAISVIKSDEISSSPALRVEQALQGRMAGVQVSQNSGAPGAPLTVRIRGTGTINNSDPLYIVDGIPVSGLDFLNPSDIESINVLKDAASAAIYGARGANGVVLIKTFSGKRNQDGIVSYSTYYGIQDAWRKPRLLNAREYAIISNEAHIASGVTPLAEFSNPDALGEGTDWVDAILNSAPTSDHQLSVTGGTEKSTYTLSGSYFNQEGIIGGKKAEFDRLTARLNMTHQVKPWLQLGNTLNYTWLNRDGLTDNSEFNSPLIRALNIDPVTPVRKADGTFAYSPYTDTDIANPVNAIEQTYDTWTTNRVVGSVFAEAEILKNLKARTTFSVDNTFANARRFYPKFDLSVDPILGDAPATEKNLVNSVGFNANRWSNWQWENTLNYMKQIGRAHSVNILLGTSALLNKHYYNGGANTNLPSNKWEDAYISNTIDPIASQSAYEGASETALNSYFGRVNYDFKNTYFLTASIRADGSSRFGANNRWGYFPSFSGSWIFTNSGFLNNYLTLGKLRASWGQNGNDNIGDYGYTSVVNSGQNYVFGPNEVITNGSVALGASNPDLRWETSTQTNIGLDLDLLDGRLEVITDYFIKNTSDMLYAIPVLSTSGTAAPVQNVASAINKGWELAAYFKSKSSASLQYNIGGNLTLIHNEVTDLGTGGEPINTGRIQSANSTVARTDVGHPLASFYGYVTDGIFQTPEEVTNHAFQAEGTAPGDIRFKDLNNDGVIDINDRTYIGNPIPKMTYGITGNLAYKGIDLTMFWQGSYGNDIYNGSVRYDFTYVNRPKSTLERWTGPGTSNSQPRVGLSDPNQNARVSDRFVEDGSYLRLKNIQLGYSLPASMLRKVAIKELRFYVAAQNLVTFTKYSGMDPEIGVVGSALELGIDKGFYPQARIWMVGLNLKF